MSAEAARSEDDSEPVQRVSAFCVTHTDCARGLEYCRDCQRTFCLECRKSGDARATHDGHRTTSLEFALDSADERFSDARSAIAQANECLRRRVEDIRLAEQQDARHVDALLASTDAWHERAIEKLGGIKERVIAAIRKPLEVDRPTEQPEASAASSLHSHSNAAAGWSAAEAVSRCEALESLVNSATADSNVALSKQHEASRMSDELKQWAQMAEKRLCDRRFVPVSAEAYLSSRLSRCLEHLDAAERDLNVSLKEVRFWKRIDQVGVTESRVIARDRLVSREDTQELTVLGIAPTASSDTVYFADANNRKIKRLNLKTQQYTEVNCKFTLLSLS